VKFENAGNHDYGLRLASALEHGMADRFGAADKQAAGKTARVPILNAVRSSARYLLATPQEFETGRQREL
jgi:hypothetical protein